MRRGKMTDEPGLFSTRDDRVKCTGIWGGAIHRVLARCRDLQRALHVDLIHARHDP